VGVVVKAIVPASRLVDYVIFSSFPSEYMLHGVLVSSGVIDLDVCAEARERGDVVEHVDGPFGDADEEDAAAEAVPVFVSEELRVVEYGF